MDDLPVLLNSLCNLLLLGIRFFAFNRDFVASSLGTDNVVTCNPSNYSSSTVLATTCIAVELEITSVVLK
jgi:hypothetical protein